MALLSVALAHRQDLHFVKWVLEKKALTPFGYAIPKRNTQAQQQVTR